MFRYKTPTSLSTTFAYPNGTSVRVATRMDIRVHGTDPDDLERLFATLRRLGVTVRRHDAEPGLYSLHFYVPTAAEDGLHSGLRTVLSRWHSAWEQHVEVV